MSEEKDEMRKEMEDRLTSQSLEEVVGEHGPPDVTERVLNLSRSQEEISQKEEVVMNTPPNASRVYGMRIALAAVVLLALGSGIWLMSANNAEQFTQISGELADGKAAPAPNKAEAPEFAVDEVNVSEEVRPLEESAAAEPSADKQRERFARSGPTLRKNGAAAPLPSATASRPRESNKRRALTKEAAPLRQLGAGRDAAVDAARALPSKELETKGIQPQAPRQQEAPIGGGFQAVDEGQGNEEYMPINENPFVLANDESTSTFSIDVDTASYAITRRYLMQNNMIPPADAVRVEEMINYFKYDYAGPQDEHPFAANMEVASCPWNPKHRLVRVALKGRELEENKRPPANLVFLLDVSGSMNSHNKLPYLKQAFRMLTDQLTENDMVSIVVYAGNSGLVLPSTPGDQRYKIHGALDKLRAGGSTNGGQGIELAYKVALENFVEGGINRVILATDGDFNVGISNRKQLENLISEKAKSGVFLSVLGFGSGNLKDNRMETLADKGNGNYAYIDTVQEAFKVFVDEINGTLVTIAKDVKIQVQFNPAQVKAYRLVGYENRVLANRDFNDDTKDAGEIGAGHTVTAFYEVIPPGELEVPGLKDQQNQEAQTAENQQSSENNPMPEEPEEQRPEITDDRLLTLRLKYKQPDAEKSEDALEFKLVDEGESFDYASNDFRFAAAVANFGLILRNSRYKGQASLDAVLEITKDTLANGGDAYRQEFESMVQRAKEIKNPQR